MMWWKQHKWKVIVPLAILVVLAGAFWYGGGAPGLQGWNVNAPASSAAMENTPKDEQPDTSILDEPDSSTADSSAVPDSSAAASSAAQAAGSAAASQTETSKNQPAKGNSNTKTSTKTETGLTSRPGGTEGGMTAEEKVKAAAEIAGGSSPGVEKGDKSYSEAHGMVIDPSTGKDKYLTDPVPEGKPLPVEPQDATVTDKALTCTLSISCATILNHMDWLNPEKTELVPSDGWILKPTTVTFYEGESVFNVLQRTCKQYKIHMEFKNTPMYNSAYIEGIHNLYEFDCGELSGWMYKVGDWFPNYGCSRYQLKNGDVICWEYTCDLGVDVGGYYSTGS